MNRFDIRTSDKPKLALLHIAKCGVKCSICGWHGYRKVKLIINFNQEIGAREIDSVIKNEMSFPVCPACRGNVGFTHYANRKPHTSQVEETS